MADRKEYYKLYRKTRRNKEKHNLHTLAWKAKNPEYMKVWRKSNRDKIRKYTANKYKTDILFRLNTLIRNRIKQAMKYQKSKVLLDTVGCSIEELKNYLESKFQPGMSWDNQGQWHIDHIVPLSRFNLTDNVEVQKASHYTNLQPMWATDNLRKGNRYVEAIPLSTK